MIPGQSGKTHGGRDGPASTVVGEGMPLPGEGSISPSTGGQRGSEDGAPWSNFLALKKESQCQGSGTSKNLFLSYCKEERSSTRLHDTALPSTSSTASQVPPDSTFLDGGTHPYLGFFLQLPLKILQLLGEDLLAFG